MSRPQMAGKARSSRVRAVAVSENKDDPVELLNQEVKPRSAAFGLCQINKVKGLILAQSER